MNILNPTSVAEAGSIMAPYLGHDWAQNRTEVVKGINRYREHLYNKYNKRRLFDDAFHCFVPQKFRVEGGGTNQFHGATLPPEMTGVVKAWNYGAPLRIRSRWREAFTSKLPCYSEMSLVVLPRTYPTEREFITPTRLRFFAESSADDGKVIFMEARTSTGPKKLRFDLKGDEWVETVPLISEVLSVVLPEGLTGSVTLATSSDFVLSVYAPWERVPSYQRVKFLQPCPNNIFIQGTRRFVPVWFDPDIVEVGSSSIMEFFAQYIRYNKARDQRDRDTAANALSQANSELDGLIARAFAGAIQDGPKRGPRPNAALPGYGRSHKR